MIDRANSITHLPTNYWFINGAQRENIALYIDFNNPPTRSFFITLSNSYEMRLYYFTLTFVIEEDDSDIIVYMPWLATAAAGIEDRADNQ